MDWLKRLLGRKAAADQIKPVRPAASPDEEYFERERMFEEGAAARTAFYDRLGEMDPDVLAPAINPTFMGGPRWPSLRQAWRVILRPGSTIIASDGLSDPFDDGTPLGFKVEVCAETDQRFGNIDDARNVAGSWIFDLVYQASQAIAHHGGIHEAVEHRNLVVTTVFTIPEAPAAMKDAEDRVGVVIGFPARDLPREIDLPDGKARLLVVKPLFPSELAYIEGGTDGQAVRNDLVSRLLQQPRAHFATANREAVV